MENVIVEIPEETGEGWQPPVLRAGSEKRRPESCLDVFFAQYAVCILVLTVLLTLRLLDEAAFRGVTEQFRAGAEGADVSVTLTQLAARLWS